MVKLLTYVLSALQLCGLSLAAPELYNSLSSSYYNSTSSSTVPVEEVTQVLFDTISLYQQYAAAAYCVANFNPVYNYRKITCGSNNCPVVESGNTNITLQLAASGTWAVNAYVAIDYTQKLVVFGLRGTNSSSGANIAADLFSALPIPLNEFCAGCYGGSGFYYAWLSVRDIVTDAIIQGLYDNPTFRVLCVGHSLGGAIATIAAFQLRQHPNITAPVDMVSFLFLCQKMKR
jgi:hypothetical protein